MAQYRRDFIGFLKNPFGRNELQVIQPEIEGFDSVDSIEIGAQG
jgi:hypothetical protein